jgi:hypothetical protein
MLILAHTFSGCCGCWKGKGRERIEKGKREEEGWILAFDKNEFSFSRRFVG